MRVVVATQFGPVVTALVRRLLMGRDVDVCVGVQSLTRQSRPVFREITSLRVRDLHARGVIVQCLERHNLSTILVLRGSSRNQIRKTEMLVATLVTVCVCVRSGHLLELKVRGLVSRHGSFHLVTLIV